MCMCTVCVYSCVYVCLSVGMRMVKCLYVSMLHPLTSQLLAPPPHLTTPPCPTHSPHNSSLLHPLSLITPPCSTHSPHNSSMLHPLPHRLNEQTCESLAGARDEVAALKAVVSQMTEAAAVLHSQLDATKVSVCGVCGALMCMYINIMSHQCAQNVCIFEVEWLCCGCKKGNPTFRCYFVFF